MSFYQIHDTLDRYLKTFVGLPPLQEENSRIKLGAGTKPWSRSTFLPNPTVRTSIGESGLDEYNGVYQIDLFYPADANYKTCSEQADQLVSHFCIGSIIDGVMITNTYPLAGYGEIANYYTIPIIVEWTYFATREIPQIITLGD